MSKFVKLMHPRTISYDEFQKKLPKLLASNDYSMEEDIDGVRHQILIDDVGNIKFAFKDGVTKHTTDFRNKFKHLVTQIQSMKLPNNTLLEGNLFFSGGFAKLMIIINYDIHIALMEQIKVKVDFICTDLVFLNNESIHEFTLFERREILEDIFSTQELENIHLLDTYTKNKESVYKKIMTDNECSMGVVFKLNVPYHFGITMKVIKYRKEGIIDVVIMDIIEGQGKFANMAGSIIIGVLNNEKLERVGTVDTMTESQRRNFFNNKQKYIHNVITVRVYTYADNGQITSSFVSLQDKKNIEDCKFEFKKFI